MFPWCILGSYFTKYGISINSGYRSEMFCIVQKIQWHIKWDILGFWPFLPSINHQIPSIVMTYQYQINISPKTCQTAKSVIYMFYMRKGDDIYYRYWHYSAQSRVSLITYIQHCVIFILCLWLGDVYYIHIWLDMDHVQQNLKYAFEIVCII